MHERCQALGYKNTTCRRELQNDDARSIREWVNIASHDAPIKILTRHMEILDLRADDSKRCREAINVFMKTVAVNPEDNPSDDLLQATMTTTLPTVGDLMKN